MSSALPKYRHTSIPAGPEALPERRKIPAVSQSSRRRPTNKTRVVNRSGLSSSCTKGADKEGCCREHHTDTRRRSGLKVLLQPGAVSHTKAYQNQAKHHDPGENPKGHKGPTAGNLHALGVISHRQHPKAQEKPPQSHLQGLAKAPEAGQIFDLSLSSSILCCRGSKIFPQL